jgi:hypothetical protein
MSSEEAESLRGSAASTKQAEATAAKEAAEAAAAENGNPPGEAPAVDTTVTDEDIKVGTVSRAHLA